MFALPSLFQGHPEVDEALRILNDVTLRNVSIGHGSSKRGLDRRTSAKKLRFIRYEDWERLSSWMLLRADQKRIAEISWRQVESWCKATLISGLRPVEWFSASVVADGNVFELVVKNAKATNGRAHGETRSLIFNSIDDVDRKAIETTVSLSRQWSDPERRKILHRIIRHSLEWAGKRALGKREAYPSLYTFRHQAIANWKDAGKTDVEIAALCGHGSLLTAWSHYSGKSRSWKGKRFSLAVASEKDMKSVLSHVASHVEREYMKSSDAVLSPKP